MNTPACPDNEILSEYTLGALSPAASMLIEQHLNDCSLCSRRLESLDQLTDPLITMLREASPFASRRYLHEPEYQTAVNTITHLKILTDPKSLPQYEKPGLPDQSVRTPLRFPATFGRYELGELAGRGGMGVVYRAFDGSHNREVIVKFLTERSLNHPKMLRRFEVEMRLAGHLNHANIVRAIDSGQIDGRQFLVFEYHEGKDLAAVLKHQGSLRIEDACEIVRQAASGLQHIHENGLVHRDLKPANLFLTVTGEIKILDLGLALLRETSETDGVGLTSPGKLMGTIDYMSPEQAEDTHRVDIRADIYSLGATLYALLCGNAPLRGKPDSSLMERLLSLSTGEFTPLSSLRPDIPEEVTQIVHRMLARNPVNRYQKPADVVTALAQWCLNAELPRLISGDKLKTG